MTLDSIGLEFVRTDGDQLPTVYEVRISGGE